MGEWMLCVSMSAAWGRVMDQPSIDIWVQREGIELTKQRQEVAPALPPNAIHLLTSTIG